MNVQAYYQGLIDAFVRYGKASGFKTPQQRVVLNPIEADGEACWELSLQNEALIMKSDVSSGGENGLAKTLGFIAGEFRILICPREIIKQNAPWSIKSSQVELAYVAKDNSKAKSDLLVGMHYDYSVRGTGEPDPAHPLFHATLTPKLLRLRTAMGANINVDRMERLPEIRLPTAHMSLPSVLLLVAADYFKEPHYIALLREIRKSNEYPCMVNQFFTARMNAHRLGMRSCAWYPN